MQLPQIRLIPAQAAVCSDCSCTLDILVKIISPAVAVSLERPPLNIGLVIDRSSSMNNKIELVNQAVNYLVQQLLPSDRISVTIFDREVRTLVYSQLAIDKTNIIRLLQHIRLGQGTALHSGWLAGSMQVLKHIDPNYLNRVILLSDGFANIGEQNIDEILIDVEALARQGLSTTTIGVGNVYDEDSLLAMAFNGRGNYYYLESCQQLQKIFHHELEDLIPTVGNNVNIAIAPQGNVEIEDIFNYLEVDHCGRFVLPDLVRGNSSEMVVRLKVPQQLKPKNLCNFWLNWDAPLQQERQKLQASLELPVVSFGQLQEFLPHPEVQQHLILMIVARAKKEIWRQLERGDFDSASQLLKDAKKLVFNALNSPLIEKEAQALTDLDNDLQAQRLRELRKTVTCQRRKTHSNL